MMRGDLDKITPIVRKLVQKKQGVPI